MSKTAEEIITSAKKKVKELVAERQARLGNGHPDGRIPAEIQEHLGELGKLRKLTTQESERAKASLIRCGPLLIETENLYRSLQKELAIANGFDAAEL